MKGRRQRSPDLLTRVIVPLPIVLALLFMGWVYLFPDRARGLLPAAISLRAGDPVPRVELNDAQGNRARLADLVAGRTAVVMLLDPKCTYCGAQLESLKRVLRAPTVGTQAPGKVVLVSVGDPAQTPELIRRYQMPIYDDVGSAFASRYGLKAIPVLLTVSPDRTLRHVRGGLLKEEELRRLMRDIGG